MIEEHWKFGILRHKYSCDRMPVDTVSIISNVI